jgi:hypothetical protein
MRSLDINGTILSKGNVDTDKLNPIDVVVAVVCAKTNNNVATVPLGTHIFDDTLFANHSHQAFRNLEETKNYSVLYKKRFTINHDQEFAGVNWHASPKQVSFSKHINLKGMVVNFKGNTGNLSDIVDNALHVYVWCDNIVQSVQPYISYQSRLRFVG